MKKTLALLSLSLALLIFSSFKINPDCCRNNNIVEKDRIQVVFTRSTSFSELVYIKSHLEKKHIFLDFQKIEYDTKGALKALSFSVNCEDGFSGRASTEALNDKVPFGFYRDYRVGASSPFGTGAF